MVIAVVGLVNESRCLLGTQLPALKFCASPGRVIRPPLYQQGRPAMAYLILAYPAPAG